MERNKPVMVTERGKSDEIQQQDHHLDPVGPREGRGGAEAIRITLLELEATTRK